MNSEKEYFDHYIKELAVLAMNDKIITAEELQIIQQFTFDLTKFKDLINEALEDGIITNEEKNYLNNFKEKILNNVQEVANLDNVVEDEEKVLINKISQILDNYFKTD
ncbi:MAG: TerB family tellurite resistance protein [Candidatus Heimdallarchaeota archaeon]|nr:TerB family tellurite resistance protein [Candidatus Heimdallarchaeota archaeon]